MRDVDDFLLPEDHPRVVEKREFWAQQEPRWKNTKKTTKKAAWPEKHAQEFERKGMDWWESSEPDLSICEHFPTVKELNYRHLDVLKLNDFTFPDTERSVFV